MPDLELIALLTARLKQLEAKLPNAVASAVQQWAEANRESLQGKDAEPITVADIEAVALPWLSENITQPENGQDADPVDMAEVAQIVNAWLTLHYAEFLPKTEVIEQVAQAWLRENIRQPADGKDASESQIKAAAELWLRENIRQPKDGEGKDGVGIDDIYQSSVNQITVELTNGVKKKFTLPQPKITGGGTTTIVNKSGGGGGSIQKFEVALSGFSYQVTQTQHGLSDIMIRVTRDADGALVSVADAIGLDGLVNIESNTSLSGHTLTLIGVTSNGS